MAEDIANFSQVEVTEPSRGFAAFNENMDETFKTIRQYAVHLIPIFCGVGIVGNSMALMLIRTNFWLRRLTSNAYLTTLSICSCLFLFTVLLAWVDSLYFVPLYSDSDLGCKFFTFLAHFCDFICVWMISWVSCDRMIVLYRPGIRKYVCNKKFGRNLVFLTIIIAVPLYSWCLLFSGLEKTPRGQLYCGLDMDAEIFGYNVNSIYFAFTMMDTLICTLVPSILIMVVNSFATYRYRQCMKIYASGVLRVRFLRAPNTENDYGGTEWKDTNAKRLLLSQTHATNTHTQHTTQVSQNSGNRTATCGKMKSSDLQLSRSLLIVTSTFVLLNVPNYVGRIYQYLFDPSDSLFQLLFFCTFLLYYLHHAVLFYMYIFWSPQMKKQLKPAAMRLLECYCFKTVPEFGHHSTSLQNFNRN